MRSERRRTLSVLLLALVTILELSAVVPKVSAWELSVTPTTRTIAPGEHATFTVNIGGTISGNPTVTLLVHWVSGVESNSYGAIFSTYSGTAPFVSTLTIFITSWASPGERYLRVVADPDGPEGSQTRDITIIVPAPWDLGVSPSSRDVGPGGSTTFTVYVTGAIAGNPNVHLYGSAPIAVTFSFSTNDQPAPFTSTMTITVNPAAPTGSRIITVSADPAGAEPPKSKQVTLNVMTLTATIPWSVSVSPTSKSLPQGASTSYSVSVTGTIPGNPNVHLMIGSPVIVGMMFSFSTNDRPAPFMSTMTVSVTSTVGPSDYSRTVIAHPASGSTDKTATFHVIVQAPSPTTWDLSVTPASAAIAPGHTASFTVSVTGSIAGNPNVELLVSPPLLGITATFTTNNVPAPFTSIMTVSVDPSKAPGDYVLPLWAHPASVLFPGPGNKGVNVHVVVRSSTTTSELPFDFSISASPTAQTIAPGGSTTHTIAVSLVSGSSQNVALSVSGAPSDASTSLNPTSGSPSFNSILSISTTSSVAPGQYTITVTGTAGAITHSATVTLTIAQSADFRIDVNPPSQTSTQGQTTSYSVNVVGLNGFNSPVALTIAGLPAGVSGTFTPSSSVPDYSSTLTLTIPSNSPTGSFALIITGSGAGITRVAKVVLVIYPTQTQAQTETQAQTQTTTESKSSVGGISETVKQNSLIIIAALALLAILFAVLATRRRGRRTIPQQGKV